MPAFQNLTGQTFGRLTVLERAKNHSGRVAWLCQCTCGARIEANANSLKRSHTQSCGCLQKERTSLASFTHGMAHKVPEYATWSQIIQRTTNPKNPKFADYGGRGIVVCQEWRDSFMAFYKDMGPKPSVKHEIDRIDNDGHYNAKNCKWATRKEQNNNTRQNHFLEFQNKRLTIAQWAEQIGVSKNVLYHRIYLKWPIERALNESLRVPNGHRANSQ